MGRYFLIGHTNLGFKPKFAIFSTFVLCHYGDAKCYGPRDLFVQNIWHDKKEAARQTTELLKARHSTCQLAPNSLKLAKKSLVIVAKHISSAEDNAMTSIQHLIQSLLFFLTEIIISCGGYCTVRKPARLTKGEWAVCSLSEHTSRPLPELAAGLK